MQEIPRLTDRIALSRNRIRANRATGMFLQETAISDIKDRLSLVNRTFTKIAVITGFTDYWSTAFPEAHITSDSDTLDLENGAYDLVIHALCLHWANDPVGQLIQCRRALRPDGLLMAVTFGGQTLHELRACLGQAEAEITEGMSPRVAPMGEIRDLGRLLQRAGFAMPVSDAMPLRVMYETAWHLMKDLRAMGEGNALNARLRRPTGRNIMIRAAEIYTQEFQDEGRMPATFELIFMTGWSPDDSQPKPLRPGSAAARLADALGADEQPLKESFPHFHPDSRFHNEFNLPLYTNRIDQDRLRTIRAG